MRIVPVEMMSAVVSRMQTDEVPYWIVWSIPQYTSEGSILEMRL